MPITDKKQREVIYFQYYQSFLIMSLIIILFIILFPFPLEHKDVFLSGNDSCNGIVGIEHGTKTYWLSGSHNTWNKEAANAVCQQMNCGRAINFSSFPTDSMKNYVINVSYNCFNITSLFKCENITMPSNHISTVATVTCSGKLMQHLELRLIYNGCFDFWWMKFKFHPLFCGYCDRAHHSKSDQRVLGPCQYLCGN